MAAFRIRSLQHVSCQIQSASAAASRCRSLSSSCSTLKSSFFPAFRSNHSSSSSTTTLPWKTGNSYLLSQRDNPSLSLHIRTMSSSSEAKFHCVHVFVKTKPGTETAFKEASLKNARNSAQEAGVVRFDVLQDKDDPTAFVLVEVYTDADAAPKAHKETAHYLEWREAVADMMAEPRQARKFDNLFPTTTSGWKYPATEALE